MIGINENVLCDFMSYHVNGSDIDEFGRFEKMKGAVDVEVAHCYFEKVEGAELPRRKIHAKIDVTVQHRSERNRSDHLKTYRKPASGLSRSNFK